MKPTFIAKSVLVSATVLAAISPTPVLANSGTPLMWAGGLHMTVGNIIIGLIEGYILARFFRAKRWQTYALMILANFFSAWIGAFLLATPSHQWPHVTLDNLRTMLVVAVAAAYILTLILEYPFVWLSLRGTPHAARRSIRASFVVQSVSYALLFGWYWLPSVASPSDDVQVVEPAAIAMPDNAVLYYISSEDGDVYSRPLNASSAVKVCDLDSTDRHDRLLVKPCPDAPSRWNLLARCESGDDANPRIVVIRDNMSTAATQPASEREPAEGTWWNFGEVPKLGAAAESAWTFRTGFWALEGLSGRRGEEEYAFHFAIETPFVNWMIRNAVHLPTDKLVFQLGADQICICDVQTQRVARIAAGRGPVVVLTPTTCK